MILGVYEKTRDNAWLRSTLPAIDRYYRFWTTEPHAVPDVGLSRYFDRGEGPAPEVTADEKDEQGRTHYDRARDAIARTKSPTTTSRSTTTAGAIA